MKPISTIERELAEYLILNKNDIKEQLRRETLCGTIIGDVDVLRSWCSRELMISYEDVATIITFDFLISINFLEAHDKE